MFEQGWQVWRRGLDGAAALVEAQGRAVHTLHCTVRALRAALCGRPGDTPSRSLASLARGGNAEGARSLLR